MRTAQKEVNRNKQRSGGVAKKDKGTWFPLLEINVRSGITVEKVTTTATELFIRLSC